MIYQMSATLGGLIKDLRLQKNISQLEIAFALGWKEPSRLSRIEQGRNSTPPRFLIENIMEAMKLSEEERNQLLMVGNYLPDEKELEEARKKIKPIVDDWKFPAYAQDYTWRFLCGNKYLYKLLEVPLSAQREAEKNMPWVLEIAFDPNLITNRKDNFDEIERKDFLLRMLIEFLYEQRGRTRERWFQELIKRMMDNKLFRELWPEAQRQTKLECNFTNFGYKSLIAIEGNKRQKLNFYYFVIPVFRNPRFLVQFYLPMDLETSKYFQEAK